MGVTERNVIFRLRSNWKETRDSRATSSNRDALNFMSHRAHRVRTRVQLSRVILSQHRDNLSRDIFARIYVPFSLNYSN